MLTKIEDIRAIRDIAANLRDNRLEPYIKECEDAYIMPALGAELYERLTTQQEPTADDLVLLNGAYYDGPNGREYCHGIRKATAYFAYARVLRNNQVNVTAFGVVQKTGSYSQPTDGTQVTDVAAEAIKMAELYLHSCVKYLHRNDDCACGRKRPGHPADSKLHIQVLN